jgi:glutamate formiminotransferase/formiminotetrahydrofolate cyclodeaminase
VTTPTAAGAASELEQLSVQELLDALEAPAPSPCGGSAAALAGAMAAALVALVARQSTNWDESRGVAAQSSALRSRLVGLASEDIRAYAAALEALSAAHETEGRGRHDHLLGVALANAADVPLEIARTAADVAELAALAASAGKEALRPDATTAAALAEAATRSAARLVEVNLATLPGDGRRDAAAAHAAAASDARRRALSDAT